jgi:cell division protease FtsH
MGGRAAEELVFGEISSGAYGDIESSTRIARAMVTEYGMSDLGPIQYEQSTGNVFLGRDYNKNKNFSDTVAHEIDTEVRKIIAECYDEAVSIISANRDLLDLIVEALLENETITKEQIEHLVEHGKMPEKEVVQEEVEEIVEVAEETVEEETDTDSEENKDNEKKLVN